MQMARQAGRSLIRLLPAGATLPIVSGRLRGRRWVVRSTNLSCWWGDYEKSSQEAFAALVRPGMTVYDVGANVGFYTLLAASLTGPAGKVVAFEPLGRNVKLLRRHLELNGIANVTVVEAAVAGDEGIERFSTGWSHREGFLDPDGVFEVPTVSLDAMIGRGLPPPDVIKMDIEGGEVDALNASRDLLARFRPALLLSTHGYERDLACRQLLGSMGYEFQPTRDGTEDGQYEMLARPTGG